MTSSSQLAGLVVVAFTALATAVPGGAAQPAMVALNRCNGQVIDESSARVRDYDRHPPANNQTALLKRYGLLSELIGTLNEEREIIDSVCTRDARQAELFAQVAAVSGAALVLQADVTAKLNATCPAAATGVPQMILADAWLGLARVVNEQNGTVPSVVYRRYPEDPESRPGRKSDAPRLGRHLGVLARSSKGEGQRRRRKLPVAEPLPNPDLALAGLFANNSQIIANGSSRLRHSTARVDCFHPSARTALSFRGGNSPAA